MSTRTVALGDKNYTVLGQAIQPGDSAPDVTLSDNSGPFTEGKFRLLGDTAGKVRLISVIPSIHTGVCDAQTRRMNEVASHMGDDVVVLTVSSDLPLAQASWCGATGMDKVKMLSDHFDMAFGDHYGTHVEAWRIEQRALFVVDRNNIVRHVEYVPTIGEQPNYEAALAVVQSALSA